MKTAAKVFIILKLVIGGIINLFFIFLLAYTVPFSPDFIIPIVIYAILALSGWVTSLTALMQMRYRKPSIGISIMVLLFGSLLGGIFLLCTSPQDYQKQKYDVERTAINRLLQYKQLADNGIISEEEFLKIKQKILE